VGSVFDVTGGMTACPVTAALPALRSVEVDARLGFMAGNYVAWDCLNDLEI